MLERERAISISGLAEGMDHPWSGSPRRAFEWVASLGARLIQLDATLAELRPRELDAGARRDLVAVLRRLGLSCCGLDLFIPPSHFVDSGFQDRAAGAVSQCLELGADLARLSARPVPVSLGFPPQIAADMLDRFRQQAEKLGVMIADHTVPLRAMSLPIGAGIDPAACFMSGLNPAKVVLAMEEPPVSARLSDFSSVGRVAPGEGQLDQLEYEVALHTAKYQGPLVLDLRGLARQRDAAARWMAKN